MMTSARRLGLASLVPLLAVLAILGCGGGGGSSSGCSKLCTQLTACATTLDTTLAVLIDDSSVTPGNCASMCDSNTSSCADKAGFFSCMDELTCTSISGVQDELNSCIGSHCGAT